MISQFFCSTIESNNYCHICILLISSPPMIYIHIIKYEGNVWEGEPTVWDNELTIWLTVGNSELGGKYHVKLKLKLKLSSPLYRHLGTLLGLLMGRSNERSRSGYDGLTRSLMGSVIDGNVLGPAIRVWWDCWWRSAIDAPMDISTVWSDHWCLMYDTYVCTASDWGFSPVCI